MSDVAIVLAFVVLGAIAGIATGVLLVGLLEKLR